jgi:hypothetical protein
MNTESCNCRRVEGGYDGVEHPGDFYLEPVEGMGGDTCIHIMLPGHTLICIPIQKGSAPGNRVWGWDGNEVMPTLTPSIHTIDHWHGYLTNGRLVSC